MRRDKLVFASLCLAFTIAVLPGIACSFDYKDEVLGTGNSDLFVSVQSVDPNGAVTVGGVDMQPLTGFTFAWGDGATTTGFFPATHTYADTARNYVVSVTANHTTGDDPTVQVRVRFVDSVLSSPPLPANMRVTIPSAVVPLFDRFTGSKWADLSFFDDTYFAVLSRTTIEGTLSLAAKVQSDLANGDHILINNRFDQVVLLDPSVNYGYSLFLTNPIAIALSSGFLRGSIDWLSLCHEMGHNVTLNFPASFPYGAKNLGAANAIYAETLAQVFSFATIYELVNNNAAYGIPDDLGLEIGMRGKNGVKLLKSMYDEYVASGMPFSSWNDSATSADDTAKTFLTLAYKFVQHAEAEGMGYKAPVQRMMRLLGTFDSSALHAYDPGNNSTAGAMFRSTLLVSAISYAFQKDLRAEFLALKFPIDDQAYASLIAAAEALRPPTLTLAKSGTGSGTVTSSPPGINCGADCSASYNSGAAVTLTASADAGSYFTGWSAPCSGNGTCTVTLTADTQITAAFSPVGFFDTVQKAFIGYYQRPADPGGLIYWAERLNSSTGNLTEIIGAYANSPEAQALYGTINSNNIGNVVDSIYMALFHRHSETEGLNYYIDGFNAGHFTAATIMLNVLDGAQNSDLASVNNKLTAANLFTKTIDPELDGTNFQVTYAGEGDVINARSFLDSVTQDPATIPTQNATTTYMKSNIADPGDPILNR
jgi:hypothetical protein